MDDSAAREGTLVLCNADRDATANNPECINARRAAATLAGRADAVQRDQREAASESRRLAARQSQEAQLEATRRAEIEALEEQELAYEAQWDDSAATSTPPPAAFDEAASHASGSNVAAPKLEFIALPRSTNPPLTTIALPRGAKPMEYTPPKPQLEAIVVPERRMAP